MILNLPVIKADIMKAEDIGPLQGQTTCRKMAWVVTMLEDLLTEKLKRHGNVTLETDIMYINEVPFVIKVSQAIQFCTAELIKNEKSTTIAMAIKQVIQVYHRHGSKYNIYMGTGNSNI